MYKNFKNIDKVIYGLGSFDQMDDILSEKRQREDDYVLFLVDQYFENNPLRKRLPIKSNDVLRFIDVNPQEPTTKQVDDLRAELMTSLGKPVGVVGIGGGSIMDIAKAISLMFTNEGSSSLYQGLNLIKNPGIYHLGVPTISGTGAECSMTAVLSGPTKKLGLKSDWTVFNQIILDPELTSTVPKNQWFYTGMDTYIHDVESESGIFYNAFSRAYGEQSLRLCREVFLLEGAGITPKNNEKLMIASLFGGLSLTYSEVGACHAISYGLSYVLGYRHGYSNCIAFNHLDEFYGSKVVEFQKMVENHNIELPQNLSKNWSSQQIEDMAKIAYNLPHMWTHAIGHDWKEKWTIEDVENIYRRL